MKSKARSSQEIEDQWALEALREGKLVWRAPCDSKVYSFGMGPRSVAAGEQTILKLSGMVCVLAFAKVEDSWRVQL